jgi:hypothetical protein
MQKNKKGGCPMRFDEESPTNGGCPVAPAADGGSSLEEGNASADGHFRSDIDPFLLSNSFWRIHIPAVTAVATSAFLFGFEMTCGLYLVGNASTIDICVFACVITVCTAILAVATKWSQLFKGGLKIELWLSAATGLTHCASDMLILTAMMQQANYSTLSPLVLSNAIINDSLYVADNKSRVWRLSICLALALGFTGYACAQQLPPDMYLAAGLALSVALHARCLFACIPHVDWVPAYLLHHGDPGFSGSDADTLAAEETAHERVGKQMADQAAHFGQLHTLHELGAGIFSALFLGLVPTESVITTLHAVLVIGDGGAGVAAGAAETAASWASGDSAFRISIAVLMLIFHSWRNALGIHWLLQGFWARMGLGQISYVTTCSWYVARAIAALTIHCTHYTLHSLYTALTIHCTHYTLHSLYTALTIGT